MQRILMKKCFLFTVGSVYHVKRSTTEKFSEGTSKVAGDARPSAEMAEKTVKRLLCCGFRRIGKAIGKVYQYWWRICREINIFSQVGISHFLRLISICDLFTLSPS
jgi:hypothetical protein